MAKAVVESNETIDLDANKSGAWLVRYALEQLPVSHTFGIPGVHNTEIYDELNLSEKIKPILVTHEAGASFIADGISRTSKGEIGCLLIVPAAGVTHAMSGIGEAFLDGIPLLVLTGGIRTDVPYGYQLHELDQSELVKAVSKGAWKIEKHEDIVPTIFEAYKTAVSGMPGPVLVEIPVNVQLFRQKVATLPRFTPHQPPALEDQKAIEQAADILASCQSPGLFVGWGAVDVSDELAEIADILGAPVATTLQGLSTFPASHPLHVGMGYSNAAVPAATNAFKHCDGLLAVGTRFGEIPTGSYGAAVPEKLVHIDIDPEVLNRSYPAAVGIAADSRVAIPALLEALKKKNLSNSGRREKLAAQIKADKEAYAKEWRDYLTERVNPQLVFDGLRKRLADDDITVVDDGNHTFLAAELFPVRKSRAFISPTDFNCMGYCVPAAIGAKLVNPDKKVVGIVGDGAFLMTGLEILTATTHNLGVVYCVFYDGELSQISQGQQIPYNRKTCTVMGDVKLEGIALATGAKYVPLLSNDGIDKALDEAFAAAAQGQPVIVDVKIDYSKRTRFTQGVVKTVLKRFPLGDKFRFIGRAIYRKVTG